MAILLTVLKNTKKLVVNSASLLPTASVFATTNQLFVDGKKLETLCWRAGIMFEVTNNKQPKASATIHQKNAVVKGLQNNQLSQKNHQRKTHEKDYVTLEDLKQRLLEEAGITIERVKS